MLTVTWLNTVRSCAIFDGTETLGALLFTKLGTIPGALLIAFLHTTYYVASHTGSLDRVFRETTFSAYDFSAKFGRKAKVVTVACWLMIALGISFFNYIAFTMQNFSDFGLLLIIRAFHLSKTQADILRAVSVIVHIHAAACWAFPQAMNHIG